MSMSSLFLLACNAARDVTIRDFVGGFLEYAEEADENKDGFVAAASGAEDNFARGFATSQDLEFQALKDHYRGQVDAFVFALSGVVDKFDGTFDNQIDIAAARRALQSMPAASVKAEFLKLIRAERGRLENKRTRRISMEFLTTPREARTFENETLAAVDPSSRDPYRKLRLDTDLRAINNLETLFLNLRDEPGE